MQQVQAHQRRVYRGYYYPCVPEERNGGHALVDLVSALRGTCRGFFPASQTNSGR